MLMGSPWAADEIMVKCGPYKIYYLRWSDERFLPSWVRVIWLLHTVNHIITENILSR